MRRADLHGLVRQSIRDAIARCGSQVATSEQERSELADRLSRVWDAVSKMAPGATAPTLDLPSAIDGQCLFQTMRRSLIALVRDASGRVDPRETLRVLGAIDDLQMSAEQETAQILRNRLQGPTGLDLLIELAHDVRTPLTSILFLTDALRSGMSGALAPAQEHQLGLIYSAAFELTSLANDLTELVRHGDQLLERQPTRFSIGNVLQSVHDIVRPIAEQRSITLRVQHSGADHRVGHPAALGRVLLNLVTNALKCTAGGSIATSATSVTETRVEFSVCDTGEGTPDNVLATPVEAPSLRRPGRDGLFSSSGLGLTICKRLVTAMHGDLKVRRASEGTGSCFFFELELPVAGERMKLHEFPA